MRFRALDAWRGLAALFVVAYHFSWFFSVFLGRFVWDSYLFVDFFFVLSGFVISHAYLDRLQEPGEAVRFVVRRFGRVWPLHFVMMAVIVATLVWRHRPPEFTLMTNQGINPIITNFFLVHSLGFHPTLTLNVPSWSISVEFFAYIVFMLLAVLTPRRMPWIAAIVILFSSAILATFAERYMDTHHDLGFFRCLYGFFSGYFVYLVFRKWGGPHGTLAELAAMAAVFYFVTIAKNGSSPVSLLAPLVFAPTVWVFASERGLISSALKRFPFSFLGEISYSIYMTHFLWVLLFPDVLWRASRWAGVPVRIGSLPLASPSLSNNLKIAGVFAFYIALVIALSAITYYLVEQPGRRFFARLSNRIGQKPFGVPATVTQTGGEGG